ncbi:uncharacterized protein Hyls1 [Epargyreus clarus]|uniref:uncharacterized protein Hyls1 n=1 Tax=Epargyreus clarus TaxID=520877 RepID=UPI003C2FC003
MEDMDYCEITSQLDAREILRYLNSIGINNISGEVLKYFITDLKKLIKYDLQLRQNKKQSYEQHIGPERLHSASTFSSRLHSKDQADNMVCSRECYKPKVHIRGSYSSPNLGQKSNRTDQKEEKPPKRSCSCIRIDKNQDTARKESTVTTGSSNLIKVPKKPIKRKCDPVSLYHYYTTLWSKYKPNVPGENNWAELRWNIRQKMVGGSDAPKVKMPEIKEKNVLQTKK